MASCEHNPYWTTINDGCMACHRDEALKSLAEKEKELAAREAVIEGLVGAVVNDCSLCAYGHPLDENNPDMHYVKDGGTSGEDVFPCGLRSLKLRKALAAAKAEPMEALERVKREWAKSAAAWARSHDERADCESPKCGHEHICGPCERYLNLIAYLERMTFPARPKPKREGK